MVIKLPQAAFYRRIAVRAIKKIRFIGPTGNIIKDIAEDQNSEAITSAIISMSHTLNMDVVVEGVETEARLAFLQSISCNKI